MTGGTVSELAVGRGGWCREMMSHVILTVAVAATILPAVSAVAGDAVGGRTMGTSWTASWHGAPSDSDGVPASAVEDELIRLLDRVDELMSTWREDSEVSRFNASDSTEWFPVSRETVRVVSRSVELSRASQGAFDVTVAPLVDLWGFGKAGKQKKPTAEDLAAVRTLVGWEKIELRDDPPAIRKTVPGVQVDLSAIAKGYAVDVLGEYLETVLVSGYLVEVGGETRVKGSRADGGPWRIGVEQPVAGQRRVRSVLVLSDGPHGIATSGDYRNRREIDGRIVSHTLDPRKGQPVEHQLAAVTVVAEDCMTADAWATMLMVMGPRKGLEFAEKKQVAALFLTRTGTTFREAATARFQAIQSGGQEGSLWNTWLAALILIVLAVGGLGVGVLVRGRGLVGSCGGLAMMCDARDDPLCSACGARPVTDDGEAEPQATDGVV